jgi:hypothetical protein
MVCVLWCMVRVWCGYGVYGVVSTVCMMVYGEYGESVLLWWISA